MCSSLWKAGGSETLSRLADLLLPSLCRQCDRRVDGGDWAPLLCRACGAVFPVIDRPLRLAGGPPDSPARDGGGTGQRVVMRGHAYAAFEGAARRLLLDLKYGGVVRAGRELGSRMAAAPGATTVLGGPGGAPDLVVPVPLHWLRRWRRGHNQAEVLARGLAGERAGLAVARVLRRARATPPQVGLDRSERLHNVRGAFAVRGAWRHALRGAVVLLVDDVVTTGGTAFAAASALRRAGAAEVRVYAAAWAPPPDWPARL